MNTSFELESTMSPKINKHQKPIKRPPTKLALNKYLRKSISQPKSNVSIKHESIIIVDSSSSCSTSTSGSSSLSLNRTPIVISESETSFDIKTPSQSPYPKKKTEKTPNKTSEDAIVDKITSTQNQRLSKEKYTNIQNWVEEVNDAKTNLSTFTEVSTVYEDENPGFKKTETNVAASSTFLDPGALRFDEFFKKIKPLKSSYKNTLHNVNDTNNACSLKSEKSTELLLINDSLITEDDDDLERDLKNLTIDDSLQLDQNDSLTTNLRKHEQKEKLQTENTQKENSETENIIISDSVEYENLLDSLYGDSWREKKDDILPSSEPRPKKNEHKTSKVVPNTERHDNKISKFNKKFVEKNEPNLLKHLQRQRFKKTLNSPWANSLKNLCDSDSESDDENRLVPVRLNFENYDNSDRSLQRKDLPSSEPRRKKADEGKTVPTSERCVAKKLNLNQNENNLLRHLQNERFKKALESPWMETVKKLCDPDTERYENKLLRVRLDFQDEVNHEKCGGSISSKSSDAVKKVHKKVTKELEKNQSSKEQNKPNAAGTYSFLASLSASVPTSKCDISALIFRNNFKQHREKLAKTLFDLFNKKVFENSIPQDTPIEWNDRMRGTAGFCRCKKITRRTGAIERVVTIVLATKVIDSADRLRDTLIHELCHAATWIVNQVSDGHGAFWKSWAHCAMKTFPELPPIKRCHEYVIKTKYTYKCTGCGYSIGRHTKSLDTERKRCGYCYGKFQVLINKTKKNGETISVPATPKKPSGFALFVKENYANYKASNLKHGEVMKILGEKFADMKVDQS